MARKVDSATALVAMIANKTLKLLCMISIRVQFGNTYCPNGCSLNGKLLYHRVATRFHLASMRELMSLIRACWAAQ
ncbi:hypothetical protein AB8Z38_15560 [Bradyrhizobium sp. LLZ17]|uniref:Secreted protein n=1 Tax=Bradyrhizobium sp. LLZ17 TaxID=3239388 RepID=A0AB39XWB9_9BRAD